MLKVDVTLPGFKLYFGAKRNSKAPQSAIPQRKPVDADRLERRPQKSPGIDFAETTVSASKMKQEPAPLVQVNTVVESESRKPWWSKAFSALEAGLGLLAPIVKASL